MIEGLIAELKERIETLNGRLIAKAISLAEWRTQLARLLSEYHILAHRLGSGVSGDTYIEEVRRLLRLQLDFLEGRTAAIGQVGMTAQQQAYAKQYAAALRTTYEAGRVVAQVGRMIPLPVLPGEGTLCGSNCRCQWRIVVLDEETADYDCYWELDPEEHPICTTCKVYHQDYYPLKIRNNTVID